MLNYDQYHREPLLSSIRWTQEATVQKQNNNSRAVKNVNNHLEAGQAGVSGRAPVRRQDPSSEYGFLPYNDVPNNEFNNYYNERAHLPEIGTCEIYSPHYRQPPTHTFEYDDIGNNRFNNTIKPVAYDIPHVNNYSMAPPNHCRAPDEDRQQISYKSVKDDGPFVFGLHSPSQFQLVQSRHDNTYDYANDEESDKSVIENDSNVLYCDKKINITSNVNADSRRSKQSMFCIKDNRKIKREKRVKVNKAKKSDCHNAGKEKNKIKCVFVGDGAVGKTSLITTYAQNTFTDSYKPTAFDNYNVMVEVDRRPISVDICDTAGQDSLEGLRELCYPGTDVIILCFSVVNPSSFQSVIKRWAPCAAAIKAPLVLVGTQSDLRHHSSVLHDLKEKGDVPVSESDAKSLASSLNAPYIETSAKMRSRLKDTFDSAILAALPVVKKKKSIWKKMFCFS